MEFQVHFDIPRDTNGGAAEFDPPTSVWPDPAGRGRGGDAELALLLRAQSLHALRPGASADTSTTRFNDSSPSPMHVHAWARLSSCKSHTF